MSKVCSNLREVVGAILLSNDQKVLLGRRSSNKAEYAGLWQAPGGGIRNGESVVAAATREVFEETGISLVDHPFEVIPMLEQDPVFTVSMLLFRLPKSSAEYGLIVADEFSDLRWFELNALPPDLVPGGNAVFQSLHFLLVNS
jgi:8-oxo-dGTP pyrophosphatase MutT (NUDIX family)